MPGRNRRASQLKSFAKLKIIIMNILMINQPLNNRGDESAHRALVRRILKEIPNAKIRVFFIGEKKDSVRQFRIEDERVTYVSYLSQSCTKNKFKYFFYDRLIVWNAFFKYVSFCYLKNVTCLWWFNPLIWPLLVAIFRSDFVVNAPGGICMGGFQVWHHIAYLKMAKVLHKDIYYYGRSIGPFPEKTVSNRRFKEESFKLLRYFKFLSLRDEKSESIACQYKIPYVPTVDSAFLDVPNSGVPQNLVECIGDDYIVFVPNVLRWHYAYKNVPKERIDNMFIKMHDALHSAFPKANIVMLPQTFNYDDPLFNDVNYFHELKSMLGNPSYIKVIADIYSSDVQQQIIAKSKLIVGARYHSIVFAINNKTPFISLSYEHKMEGLLNIIGGKESMIDISDLSSDEKVNDIMREFSSILSDRNSKNNAACLYNKAMNIANSCFSAFYKSIKNNE